MKKCPNCQKEFPDTMRFCQTDGTPLPDPVESQPEDPLKTTVVRQEDIASSIPSSDPFKTMVAAPSEPDDDDLLQLPEKDFDPMQTMVVQPLAPEKPVFDEPETPKFEDIKDGIKPEAPYSSPFGGFSTPKDPLPEVPKDYSNDPTLMQPEPPKFSEPDLSPPSFGDLSSSSKEDDLPQTVMQNPWDAPNTPKSDESPYINDSPFSKPSDAPMASPFDAPKSSFDEPQSPFGQPKSPYDSPNEAFNQPTSFDAPQTSSYDAPQTSFDPPKATFQEPANQFGSAQFDQANQGFGNQPLQQNEWGSPVAPDQGWGGAQGAGSNSPIQAPPAAGGGQNQTLPIVSLVFGILSICCYVSPITGLVALVTGFMGMKNANNDPVNFGGKGLAIAGMAVGGIFFLLGVVYYIFWLVIGMGAIMGGN